jgi:hypothetical protein
LGVVYNEVTSATGGIALNRQLRRVITVGIWAFIISVVIGLASRIFVSEVGLFLGMSLLVIIVMTGILFDMIGTAVTAAQEKPFHAMSAKRIMGARHSLYLVRNADQVANFCNDMVGDICGTLSGAVGAGIVYVLVSGKPRLNEPRLSIIVVALVAAFTVAGKAAGKAYSINKADYIITKVGRFLALAENVIHIRLVSDKGHLKNTSKTRHQR